MANSPVTGIQFLVSSALCWSPLSVYPLQKEILVTHSKFKANENNLTKSSGEQSRLAGIQNVNWSGNVSKAALVLQAWRDWIHWNVPPGWRCSQSLGPHSLWNLNNPWNQEPSLLCWRKLQAQSNARPTLILWNVFKLFLSHWYLCGGGCTNLACKFPQGNDGSYIFK